ncbi:hypothetical protein MPRM_38710 [Mycobacterium parmense]|uniref:Uncharacterized protein n=1 Tax=Mycobacterium parmense TaxID=185642 RepID=A0A7I7YXW2_9MYCO|nr:hypothetical protein MPRM_38710 [Mycobacterium parmense]
MVGVRIQNGVLRIEDPAAQHFCFVIENTRFSHCRRCESLCYPWETVAAAHRMHECWSEFIDLWYGGASRPVAGHRRLVRGGFGDTGVALVGSRDDDGAQ